MARRAGAGGEWPECHVRSSCGPWRVHGSSRGCVRDARFLHSLRCGSQQLGSGPVADVGRPIRRQRRLLALPCVRLLDPLGRRRLEGPGGGAGGAAPHHSRADAHPALLRGGHAHHGQPVLPDRRGAVGRSGDQSAPDPPWHVPPPSRPDGGTDRRGGPLRLRDGAPPGGRDGGPVGGGRADVGAGGVGGADRGCSWGRGGRTRSWGGAATGAGTRWRTAGCSRGCP